MIMRNHLSGKPPRGRKPGAVYHIVQASFQKFQKLFSGISFPFHGSSECFTELAFHNSIEPFHFLLFAELQTKVRKLPMSLYSMLPRGNTQAPQKRSM